MGVLKSLNSFRQCLTIIGTEGGTATYSYTDNGEFLTKTDGSGTTTYTQDALGNLRAVTLPDGTTIPIRLTQVGRRRHDSNIPFKISGMRFPESRRAPLLAEHTEEICREILGMSDEEIQRPIGDGVLGAAQG